MKNTWLPFLLFLALVLSSNGFSVKSSSLINSQHELAVYGEYIYQRENCQRCHTQKEEEATIRKISLDGLGGKFSNLWLYYYLQEPRSINPDSKKASYSHLHQNPLGQTTFEQLTKEKLSDSEAVDIDSLWPKLLREADALSDELKRDVALDKERTEILALIAYLQQIPASPYKLKLDSIAHAEELKKKAVWDEALQNDNSIVFNTRANRANIKKGKYLFDSYCVVCHGRKGEGGIGPNLTDKYWLHGSKKRDIANTIVYGKPEKGMIAWKGHLSPEEVGQLVVFVQSIQGSRPANAKQKQGKKE